MIEPRKNRGGKHGHHTARFRRTLACRSRDPVGGSANLGRGQVDIPPRSLTFKPGKLVNFQTVFLRKIRPVPTRNAAVTTNDQNTFGKLMPLRGSDTRHRPINDSPR